MTESMKDAGGFAEYVQRFERWHVLRRNSELSEVLLLDRLCDSPSWYYDRRFQHQLSVYRLCDGLFCLP